jgi:predicted acyltransferase
MTAWDLIQPFFMFIVGAVMPISFGRRWKSGETWTASLRHVLSRSLLLLACGEISRSIQAKRPVIDVINVLGQLAFTYPVAFLLLRTSWRFQACVAFGLLAAHWALYRFVTAPGVTGPWDPDANIGWYLDGLVLGKHWGDHFGYATINCVSSAANTIFGVMAGALLSNPAVTAGRKVRTLVLCGLAAIASGLALDPVIPIIKKIWTPSFAIYSAGYTLLALALFYWICDVRKQTAWARMFLIVGANSIFIYLFHETIGGYFSAAARRGVALIFTGPWSLLLAAWIVIALHVAICWELWRRRIFFRL